MKKEITVDGEAYVLKSAIKVAKRSQREGAATAAVPFEVGEKYLFRGVTTYQVGRVKDIVGHFLVLEGASWVADTGRFHDAMKNGFGSSAEIEPIVGISYLNIEAVMDAFVWPHGLPTKQQ